MLMRDPFRFVGFNEIKQFLEEENGFFTHRKKIVVDKFVEGCRLFPIFAKCHDGEVIDSCIFLEVRIVKQIIIFQDDFFVDHSKQLFEDIPNFLLNLLGKINLGRFFAKVDPK